MGPFREVNTSFGTSVIPLAAPIATRRGEVHGIL